MAEIKIEIINESTVLKDAELAKAVAAVQTQVHRDFAPVWGIDADLTFVPKGKKPRPEAWWVVVSDNSDQAGALGYHDLTGKGLPLGKVFAESDIQSNSSWTNDLSHEVCLVGETKIPLLNGTEVAIKDLVGIDHFWVYSCEGDGQLRPGRGHEVHQTGAQVEVVKVLLDNGESVTCTRDHQFLSRDGSYKRACDLSPGDSLMPLYKRPAVLDAKKKRRRMHQYEQVFNPASGGWVWTHRMAVPYRTSGYVRHHKNSNRVHNSPDDLEVVSWETHQKPHADHVAHYSHLGKGTERNLSPEHIAALDHQRWHIERGKPDPGCELCARPTDNAKPFFNHRVVSVEPAGRADVYDFVVDRYHNFAVSSGVFVHNCEMLGDPDINLAAYREEGGKVVFYAYEVCDPCEDDPDGYEIGGVLVSDFVFPAWFEGFRKEGSTQFDFRKHISKPFQLLPNGYIGVFDPSTHRGWRQVDAKMNPRYISRPRPGSRRQRRNMPREEWQLSLVRPG